MIEVKDLTVYRGKSPVLSRVSFCSRPQKILGIIGPNGAGKSTLLSAIYRELRYEGEIFIDGVNSNSLSRKELAKKIAVMAQDHGDSLPLSVTDTVMLGRWPHRNLNNYGNQKDFDLVYQALASVNMLNYKDRLLNELSGGEQQRVLLARTIVQDTDYLLLDEPLNHLDIHHQFTLIDLVKALKKPILIVLHDLNLAAQICDDILLLANGKAIAFGSPQEVLCPEILSKIYQVNVTRHQIAGKLYLTYNRK